MHHARAGGAHGRGDLRGPQSAAQQPGRRAHGSDRCGVAREHVRGLSEVLPHEPREVLHRALLATGRAIAVVQKQDHSLRKPRMFRCVNAIPAASVVIPTRARPRYLEVALASIAPQAAAAGAEVLVIDDAGPSRAMRALVEDCGARYVPHPEPLGLNVARNTGVAHSRVPLVVFVDDDVEVAAGWLRATAAGRRRVPAGAGVHGTDPRAARGSGRLDATLLRA